MTVPAADRLLLHRCAHYTTGKAMEAAADLLDAIDALHQPEPDPDDDSYEWCIECDHQWPCPTARLLHPEGTTP
jgi:hypothetical protein